MVLDIGMGLENCARRTDPGVHSVLGVTPQVLSRFRDSFLRYIENAKVLAGNLFDVVRRGIERLLIQCQKVCVDLDVLATDAEIVERPIDSETLETPQVYG